MKTVNYTIVLFLTVGLLIAGTGCKKVEESSKSTMMEKTSQVSNETKAQTICPVMGNPINKGIYVDYQGKRVYFCCQDCKTKFNANPEKYIKQIEEKGIQIEKLTNAEK